MFEIPLYFYWDHYRKYCLRQNQFPCFELCNSVSVKCWFLPLRIPLCRPLHRIKQEWKVEQEIEKRVPVVLWRLLCLLLFPLNMPACWIFEMYEFVPHVITLTALKGKILVRNVPPYCCCFNAPLHFIAVALTWCVIWHLWSILAASVQAGWLLHFKGHEGRCTEQLVCSLVFPYGLQRAHKCLPKGANALELLVIITLHF